MATHIVSVDLCLLPPTSQNQRVRGCAFRAIAENNLVRWEMPSPSDSRTESRLMLLNKLVRILWQAKNQRFGVFWWCCVFFFKINFYPEFYRNEQVGFRAADIPTLCLTQRLVPWQSGQVRAAPGSRRQPGKVTRAALPAAWGGRSPQDLGGDPTTWDPRLRFGIDVAFAAAEARRLWPRPAPSRIPTCRERPGRGGGGRTWLRAGWRRVPSFPGPQEKARLPVPGTELNKWVAWAWERRPALPAQCHFCGPRQPQPPPESHAPQPARPQPGRPGELGAWGGGSEGPAPG